MSLNPILQPILEEICTTYPLPGIKESASKVQLAISNWSSRGNDCACANFFYRVGQVFMTIFGQSDWQKARKSLDAIVFDLVKDAKDVPSGFYSLVSKCSDHAMKMLLKMNDADLETSSGKMKLGMELAKDTYQFAVDVSGDVADLAIIGLKQEMGVTPEMIKAMLPMAIAQAPAVIGPMLDKGIGSAGGIAAVQKALKFLAAASLTPKQFVKDLTPALAKVGLDVNLVWSALVPVLSQKGITV